MICIIPMFNHLIIMFQERLAGVYQELGSENLEPVLFATLVEHPIIQDIVSSLHTYKATVSSLFHLIQINEMNVRLHSLTDITGTTPRGKFFDFMFFVAKFWVSPHEDWHPLWGFLDPPMELIDKRLC